ncbi:hypothetical protein SK128_004053 [Halocaridina rubra]|uniref:Strictosidine synthase conserved region domain-containing protein n=1 Tax=Halocaridina rubra TaxID=373956 RepID=A0AAN8XQF7_HALRR
MGFIVGFCRRVLRIILDIIVVLLLITFLPGIPPNVSFTAYELDDALPFDGPLAKNEILNNAERILDGKIIGPESVASRRSDEIFVSLHNGKILRLWGKNFDHFQTVTTIGPGCDGPWQERICGRPLGMRFAPDGRLIIADAYLGLFALNVDTGEKERLVDTAVPIDGVLAKLPDDLDIDEEGNIYWSDASTVSDLSDGFIEMSSDPSGRLLKFDPKTKTNTVLLKNVHFANGVQLSPGNDFVLLCETFRSRVLRYWLKGPNAGKTDVFVDRLPGRPDNIRARRNGGYYVSLVAVDNEENMDAFKFLTRMPLLRKLILRLFALPKLLFDAISWVYPNQITDNISYKIFHLQPIVDLIASNACVIVELDANGKIVGSLQGDNGKVRLVSETDHVGNYLFFGSPYNNYLGYLHIGGEEEVPHEEQPAVIEVMGEGVTVKTLDEKEVKQELKQETKTGQSPKEEL